MRLSNVRLFIYCYLELGTVTKTAVLSCHAVSCYVTNHIWAAAEAIATESYDTSVASQNLFSHKVDMGHGLQIWRAAVADS
jgi:hypothetical protein